MPRSLPATALLALFLLFLASPTKAAEAPPPTTPPATTSTARDEAAKPELELREEVEVRDRASDLVGIADATSEGFTGQTDLARRPLARAGEILETVPGLIVTQHSGSGKANQYFLRGFNLDHGTDFRVTVDGMQVNFPSHGHGQGYSDVNFLIPELVQSVRYSKGGYDARLGDFSAAGAAEISYLRTLDRGLLELGGGEFGRGRLLAADSVSLAGGQLLGALEAERSDGPWKLPEDAEKKNALLRFSRGDDAAGFSLSLMAYDNEWASTDQVPRRAVASGALERYGFVDPSDGGETRRTSLSGEWRRGSGDVLWRVSGYALDYDMALYSNFTYFLDDADNGDQFEQRDERTVFGGAVEREWTTTLGGGREASSVVGLDLRRDDIDNGLFHTTARRRLSATRRDAIEQWGGGLFAQTRVRWNPWLRTVQGLRFEGYQADVTSDLADNSGDADDQMLAPKFSAVFGPWNATEIALNIGQGFHSNDARGATLRVDPASGDPAQRVDPLVRSRGGDLGVRTSAIPGLELAVTGFWLELDSELVFVGDAGGTEASRPSRRSGVELQTFWRPKRWLSFDVDAAFSRGRFRDEAPEGDHIPGSIERTLSAGVAFEDLRHWSGALRVRHFGPRSLIEDDSQRSPSSTLVNARVGYRFAGAGLGIFVEAFNLLDEEADDITYFYESRLPGEIDPVADQHFHPAEPRSLRVGIEWRFGN
jgi:hypothetical protein